MSPLAQGLSRPGTPAPASPSRPSRLRAILPSWTKPAKTPGPEAAVNEALKAINKGSAPRLADLVRMVPDLLVRHTASGHTLLTHAVASGKRDAVNVILHAAEQAERSGADSGITLKGVVNLPDLHGRTALAHAALQGHPGLARRLLELHRESGPGTREYLADVNLPDLQGFTPLYHATKEVHGRPRGAGKEVALSILERPDVLPDETPPRACTPMELAIQRGTPEIVNAIANHQNADPNLPDAQRRTPVWQAMERWESHPNYYQRDFPWAPMLRDLLASPRVDAQARSAAGRTPLTHILQVRPDLGPFAAEGLQQLHASWISHTLTAVLEGTRGRGTLDLRATDSLGFNAITASRSMEEIYPRYRNLTLQLVQEAAHRDTAHLLGELQRMRDGLGNSGAGTPEQAQRARSYVGQLVAAQQAAMSHDVPTMKRIATQVQEAAEDDVDAVDEAGADAPKLVEGDYNSIATQLTKTYRLADAVHDRQGVQPAS